MRYLRIQGRMHFFEKMSQSVLNHVLILQKYRTQKMLQIPLKVIDLQNDCIGRNVIYFALGITEGRPAGAFWADKIIF